MRPMEHDARERLARTWLRYQRVEGEHRFWAVSRAMALVDEDPEELWKVVLELVRFADTENCRATSVLDPLRTWSGTTGPPSSIASRAKRVVIEDSASQSVAVWAWDADVRPRIDALLETLQEPRR